jgi:hypothetical protein
MNNPSLDSLLLALLATQTPTSVEAHNGDTTITFPPPAGTTGPVLTVAKRWRIKAEPLGRPVATNSIQVAINGFNRSTDNYEVVEAFDACLARTEPIKQAEIIAALKSITATP